MRYFIQQLRLYIAEKMIGWAFDFMPDDSKEKVFLARAIQIYGSDVSRADEALDREVRKRRQENPA